MNNFNDKTQYMAGLLYEHEKSEIYNCAKLFAYKKHRNHIDDNGAFYFFSHIKQVVAILNEVTNDDNILCAAWLHDTIEDTETTYNEIVQFFGETIANLVMEVTQEGKKDNIGYYFPRLHSKEAIMIKFADRLSNLSRMENWSQDRQDHYLKKSKFWKSEI